MGLSTAIKAFWFALTDQEKSERINAALSTGQSTLALEKKEPVKNIKQAVGSNASSVPGRSDAIELLATLQREARFVDFVKEPLDTVADDAIGAAARTLHDRCATIIERCFEIRPLVDAQEGESITLPGETARNSSRVQLLQGSVDSTDDVKGRLLHAGWTARKCALPKWSGNKDDALILAPMEIDN